MWYHSLESLMLTLGIKNRGYLFDPGFPITTSLHCNQSHLPKVYSFLYFICHLWVNVELDNYHYSAIQTFCLLLCVCRSKKPFPTRNTRENIKLLNCLKYISSHYFWVLSSA